MFYIDDDNNIFISKGDTAVLDIELYKGDNPYTMQVNDKLVFGVRASNEYNYTLFEKVSGTPSFSFDADDTNDLSEIECDYSITMHYANGNIDTFITGKFNILGVSHGNIV